MASGSIDSGYTIGVNQNQNCSSMPKNCPASRKNTLSTPATIPRPSANTQRIASTGSIASR